jgi:hypothetical protein
MRSWIVLRMLSIALFFIAGSKLYAVEIKVEFTDPQKKSSGVLKYDMLEFGISLDKTTNEKIAQFLKNGTGINPFNPESISIEATFTSVNKEVTRTVYGFYYIDYERDTRTRGWNKKNSPFDWLVRFAPNVAGNWTVSFKVITKEGEKTTAPISFNCKPSSSKGYVIRGYEKDERSRYLRFSENNAPFFAIGENMAWVDYSSLKPKNTMTMKGWMKELSDNGGNFIRLGMPKWGLGFEWEKLGNYEPRLSHAWELDQLVSDAESKGIYINLVFDWPQVWLKEVSWNQSPYKTIDGVEEPMDFFSNPTAKKFYKNRLRYIVSRWGYSTSISVYELVNELDAIADLDYDDDAKNRTIFNQWFKEMYTYIKEELGDGNHLIGASLKGGFTDKITDKIFPIADLSFIHDYGRDQEQDYFKRHIRVKKLLTHTSTKNQPVILQEVGNTIYPTIDYCSDYSMHNAIWSSAFSGAFGCGMMWWWDNAVHPKGYYSNFKALNTFMSAENLSSEAYKQQKWKGGSHRNGTYENFALVKKEKDRAIGWVHNMSYWWANQYNSNECIKTAIDKCNGVHRDKADDIPYCEHRAQDQPKPIEGETVQLQKMKARSKFTIQWYDTRTGAHLSQHDAEAKSRLFGRLRFIVPKTDEQHPDYAYRIKLK